MTNDFLKDIWSKQEVENSFSQAQIFKMLSRKSLNNVKIILWVNAAEILFTIALYIYGIINKRDIMFNMGHNSNNDQHLKTSFEFMYDVMYPISLIVMIFFFVLFIIKYRKLHTQQTVKEFIERLIAFRKVSYWYMGTSVTIGLLSLIYVSYTGIVMPGTQVPIEKLIITIGIVFVFMIIFLLLIGVYYFILYGIVLRKINKNLITLKEIEEEEL
ncbi:hypothetical protein UJ101_01873 [Flavobacteriaceae bacterium UJ101]|nr:hypothetical protein UJ101_01873 [Flavobacteriaceae bacterium UJ101]